MSKIRIISGLVAIAVVFGCGGANTNSLQAPDPVVAFINASPDGDALDAFLNNIQLGNNVPYLSSSPRSGAVTTFRSVEPGDYDVRIEPDGAPENGDVTTQNLTRDTSTLTTAMGLVDPAGELNKRLQTFSFQVDRSKPNGEKARLVIVHALIASPGFDTPAIDFRNPDDNPLTNVQNIEFGGNNTALIDSGNQTFVARISGTEFEITPQATFNFGAGKIYAAIVCGIEDEVGPRSPRIVFMELQPKQ
jgi:hypothetical protein